MTVVMRLKRIGTHRRPFYTIVAVDSRRKRDGRVLEVLGHYDPGTKAGKATLSEEKIRAWVEKGALISPTAKSLLKIHRRHGKRE